MHLWFLPALLAYSTLLVLVWQPLRQPPLAGLVQRIHHNAMAHPRTTLALLTLAVTAWEVFVHLAHQTMVMRDGTLPYLLANRLGAYRIDEAGALALVLVLSAGGLAFLTQRWSARHA